MQTASTNHGRQKQDQQPLVPFDSFPRFNFPSFGERGSREVPPRAVGFASSNLRNSKQKRPITTSSTRPQVSGRSRSNEARYNSPAIFQAEGQRIYPSVNGRHPFSRSSRPSSRSSSSRNPFNPSPKIASGSKFRGSSKRQNSLPNGFRDFHETFYGQRDRGNQKRPGSHSHRQKEYASVDNSLLGSGNFEILSGGTFHEDKKTKKNSHPYDSFLDDEYSHNERDSPYKPQINNYVDDFFSNFRDFSEFAARRSDKSDRDDFFGYGSENVHKYVPFIPSHQTNSKQTKDEYNIVLRKDAPENIPKSLSDSALLRSETHQALTLSHPPRNIQEVMQQVEAEPSNSETATLSVDEKDPLIATF